MTRHKDDMPEWVTVLFVLLFWLTGVLIGTYYTNLIRNSIWERETIKRGVAEYNQTTGKWQWKEAADADK